ncbi:MAG: diaminopimelate dehydrogenase [Clostridiales bacterium]|nr:diaminopimelate dehydrogenase [Clostridiales bacterium]
MTLKLAIVGYGFLGKSLEKEIAKCNDLELAAIYSRRSLDNEKYRPLKQIGQSCDFDVALLALGSYNEITEYAPLFERLDTVDSFDTHAKIEEYKIQLNRAKKDSLAIISTGWDPGLLSLARGVFSVGADSCVTLWGEGVSQGHSNAIRVIRGVIDAVQFTKPKDNALELIRQGVTKGEKLHDRICYVACVDEDKDTVKKQIVEMPNYFKDYDTTVVFCAPQEVRELRQRTAHRGQVICHGEGFVATTDVRLDCNTDYTAKIMLSYAKAIPQLKKDGYRGALDVYDVPLRYLADNKLI